MTEIGISGRVLGAMDVGGSHVSAAVIEVTAAGTRILGRQDSALESGAGRDELLSQLVAPARRLRDADGVTWTIALPGPFDYSNGRGTFEGVGKFQSIAGLDLRSEVGSRLGVASEDVKFVNDAEAYGRGEWWSGARADHFVCITLGTGVGSVFLDRGSAVTTGDDVPPHGWVHLLSYRGRPLEDSVSTAAIRAEYARLTAQDADVRAIAERARGGDDAARDAIERPMRILGEALGPWFARFRATDVVIGGAIARSWDLIEKPIRDGIALGGAPAEIRLRASALLSDAPLIGAALS